MSNAYILRLPCLTYANFSIAKNDHALIENVLKTFQNLNEHECEKQCIWNRFCKSINTRTATGENCQLISKSVEDTFDDVELSSLSGWTYKTTDHKARNVNI